MRRYSEVMMRGSGCPRRATEQGMFGTRSRRKDEERRVGARCQGSLMVLLRVDSRCCYLRSGVKLLAEVEASPC